MTLGVANAPPQEQAGASPLKLEDESTPFQGTVELNPTFEDLHEGKPGCVIPKPELRAITEGQLNKLAKHVEQNCESEGWADSRDPSNKFTAQTFNLYAMDAYIVRPATKARKCAYVELVAICAQPPKWFCSHWWGEPVLDFVACVVTHALDHGYSLEGSKNDPTAAYWVCAYANNQWDLTSVNAPTLEGTSFYKASVLPTSYCILHLLLIVTRLLLTVCLLLTACLLLTVHLLLTVRLLLTVHLLLTVRLLLTVPSY